MRLLETPNRSQHRAGAVKVRTSGRLVASHLYMATCGSIDFVVVVVVVVVVICTWLHVDR